MSEKTLPEVQIYSDWWANPNPGPGWYGVILCYQWIKKELLQWYTRTTNNRMELLGAITGLKNLKTRSHVTLYTDSQYTINGIKKWWAEKWKANNWQRKWNQKAINADLWAEFLELTQQHQMSFEWVKWHNGHVENERCDELATLALEWDDLIVDEGFVETGERSSENSTKDTQTVWDIDPSQIVWLCKKCNHALIEKVPKHSKKTLEKKYYYAYYHHCPWCKTNYMLEEAKRDIRELNL